MSARTEWLQSVVGQHRKQAVICDIVRVSRTIIYNACRQEKTTPAEQTALFSNLRMLLTMLQCDFDFDPAAEPSLRDLTRSFSGGGLDHVPALTRTDVLSALRPDEIVPGGRPDLLHLLRGTKVIREDGVGGVYMGVCDFPLSERSPWKYAVEVLISDFYGEHPAVHFYDRAGRAMPLSREQTSATRARDLRQMPNVDEPVEKETE